MCVMDVAITIKCSFACRFGQGSGQIWLDDVDCTGTESRLTSCSNNGIGVHDCSHYEDVAIYCASSGNNFELLLRSFITQFLT